jgi:Thioredoxin-like
MFPHERSLVEKHKDAPFVIIGVNSDETAEKLREVQKSENLTWRSFFAGPGGGEIARQFNVRGWPTVYLLDKDMTIRWKGHSSPDDALIEKLIADAAGGTPAKGEKSGE